jgi:predicted aspartyl protease
MAKRPQVTSSRYPYLSIRVTIRGHSSDEQLALIDTGFSGYLAMPATFFNGDLGLPDTRFEWELADGSTIDAPVYFGSVEIIGLPAVRAAITVLGNEYILGRGV